MLKQRGFIRVSLYSTLLTGLLFFSSNFVEAGQTYTVAPGDSLWKISQKFSISTSQLIDINNLASDEIWVGQQLIVTLDDDNAKSGYIVKPGDSLYLVAKAHNISVTELKAANGLTSDEIRVGQLLTIPTANEPSKPAVPEEPKSPDNLYTVKKGDTLYLISQALGTSVTELKTANNLTSNEIWVGQKLVIPNSTPIEDNPQNQKYTVVPGDSLYLIAKRFGTTVDKLMSINQLTDHNLYVGQQLVVSGDQQPQPAPEQPAPAPGEVSWQIPSGVALYHVKSGDSLSGIAQKYGSSVDAIISTNHMKGQLITPEMPLFVPINSKNAVPGISAPKGPQKTGFGELLPWEFANWYFNHESTGVIRDLATGTTFKIKRIGGGNHADCEPLTASDTAIMKSLYGGEWSWLTRPVILEYQGRQIAASIAGMPHSFDTIPGNNFNGMFDLHFLHSRTHNTNAEDPKHQQAVQKAAGN